MFEKIINCGFPFGIPGTHFELAMGETVQLWCDKEWRNMTHDYGMAVQEWFVAWFNVARQVPKARASNERV